MRHKFSERYPFTCGEPERKRFLELSWGTFGSIQENEKSERFWNFGRVIRGQ